MEIACAENTKRQLTDKQLSVGEKLTIATGSHQRVIIPVKLINRMID
jgi:predicted thioesterase